MPVTPTYPGVYIEEIPSGVRTITGVATSITAFIGRALRGPVNWAVTINSYADFERIFGGLWLESSLGYAVRDFYLNGGSQAIIVRLFNPVYASDEDQAKAEAAAKAVADAAKAAADGAAAKTAANTEREKYNDKSEVEKKAAADVATAIAALADDATKEAVAKTADAAAAKAAPKTKTEFSVGELTLQAAYEGAWSSNLRIVVDKENISAAAAANLGLAMGDLFNLTVTDVGPGGSTEQYLNLSTKESLRRIDRVLAAESRLIRWKGTLDPNAPPTVSAATDAVTAAEKKLATAKKALTDKQNANPAADVTGETNAVKTAQTELDSEKDKRIKAVSDGNALKVTDFLQSETGKKGMYALEEADLFNLLCIPPYKADGNVDANLLDAAIAYCEKRRAMLLIDPPADWRTKEAAKTGIETGVGSASKNAAVFFPRLRQPNPLRDNQMENFAPCGAVAGTFARTDTQRGVWKAPAGLDATLVGVPELSVSLTDPENGELNPKGINCLRAMPAAGRVIWGSRTRVGDDRLASEWKYIPVRRTALFIEESLYRGTHWVVFEPNDEPLWAQIRLNVGAFMHNLFRQGAFQGRTPREAYFVKCDKETTTQNDINLGIVNIVVGFAPLKPAEFVIVKLQQIAGQIQT
jgi:uncharacterized protein